eukprot:SAG11_NODE_92_length_17132_cov_10.277285_17_plen_103_part_00
MTRVHLNPRWLRGGSSFLSDSWLTARCARSAAHKSLVGAAAIAALNFITWLANFYRGYGVNVPWLEWAFFYDRRTIVWAENIASFLLIFSSHWQKRLNNVDK